LNAVAKLFLVYVSITYNALNMMLSGIFFDTKSVKDVSFNSQTNLKKKVSHNKKKKTTCFILTMVVLLVHLLLE
jgi:predicted tellurium resistance membrane protein TerC